MASIIQPQAKQSGEQIAAAKRLPRRSLFELCFAALATLRDWRQRSRERKELARLPSHILKDIGLNEADRYRETRKRFWEE